MNILLLGKSGQVGTSILNSNKSRHTIFAFDRHEMPLDKKEILSSNLSEVLKHNEIDFLINAAAFTDVNAAEENVAKAFEVNSNALATITGELEKASRKKNTVLIHFSTDYVFDGSGETSWLPGDKKNPLNVYGRSKDSGEDVIKCSNVPSLIFRTSWVFSKEGNNFLNKILKNILENETLNIVDDQIGSPTSADFISDFCMHLLEDYNSHNTVETYHLTGRGVTSWFEFAKFIIKTAQSKGLFDGLNIDLTEKIIPVKSSSFISKAKRPKNSYLDCTSLEKTFNFHRTTWQEQTEDILKKIISEKNI